MGTWDEGILDNDTALDGLGEVTGAIGAEVVRLGAQTPGARATPRLAAGVGLLLQLSPFDFSPDCDRSGAIVDAVKIHLGGAGLSPKARALLERVASGEGESLAQRPAKLAATLAKALHTSGRSGFGRREAALFDTRPGAAYVQEVARACVVTIDEDFEDEDTWWDLCREGLGMGALASLLVLEPCKVPRSKLERWRRCARQGLEHLEREEDDELDFQRPYYRNLDRVFAALLRRHA